MTTAEGAVGAGVLELGSEWQAGTLFTVGVGSVVSAPARLCVTAAV